MGAREEQKEDTATDLDGFIQALLDSRPDRLKKRDEKRIKKEQDAAFGVPKDSYKFGIGRLRRMKNERNADIEMRDVRR